MGWIIGIIAAVCVIGWLYSQRQPNDMESVIRRLPEAERRQLYRDFKKIERDEPMESDPEYGGPGTPWGMFDGEGADGRLRAHWTHSSEAKRPATGQGWRRVSLQGRRRPGLAAGLVSGPGNRGVFERRSRMVDTPCHCRENG